MVDIESIATRFKHLRDYLKVLKELQKIKESKFISDYTTVPTTPWRKPHTKVWGIVQDANDNIPHTSVWGFIPIPFQIDYTHNPSLSLNYQAIQPFCPFNVGTVVITPY